jgi:hypothetical protein
LGDNPNRLSDSFLSHFPFTYTSFPYPHFIRFGWGLIDFIDDYVRIGALRDGNQLGGDGGGAGGRGEDGGGVHGGGNKDVVQQQQQCDRKKEDGINTSGRNNNRRNNKSTDYDRKKDRINTSGRNNNKKNNSSDCECSGGGGSYFNNNVIDENDLIGDGEIAGDSHHPQTALTASPPVLLPQSPTSICLASPYPNQRQSFYGSGPNNNNFSPSPFNHSFLFTSSYFRITFLNRNYTLCTTYPRFLVVPASVSDNILLKCASFRTRGRLPVITYVWNKMLSRRRRKKSYYENNCKIICDDIHNLNVLTNISKNKKGGNKCILMKRIYNCDMILLARSSQPMTGLLSSRCEEDEILLKALTVFKSNEVELNNNNCNYNNDDGRNNNNNDDDDDGRNNNEYYNDDHHHHHHHHGRNHNNYNDNDGSGRNNNDKMNE